MSRRESTLRLRQPASRKPLGSIPIRTRAVAEVLTLIVQFPEAQPGRDPETHLLDGVGLLRAERINHRHGLLLLRPAFVGRSNGPTLLCRSDRWI